VRTFEYKVSSIIVWCWFLLSKNYLHLLGYVLITSIFCHSMLGNFKISKASHFYKIEQPKKTENEIATTSRHIWNVAWSPWSFLTQLSLLHLLLIQQPLINISSTFFSILFLARINICNFLASKFSEICYFYDKYITETSLWFWGFNMIV